MLAFRSRGVMRSVWQEHIEGDLVKLYGIRKWRSLVQVVLPQRPEIAGSSFLRKRVEGGLLLCGEGAQA